eukprot:CAMPEP_0116870208 /NCGR_PEP_ID=MMETSP0463-20121206/77_1 /TAXON_ID=181622 /ORGANISM="Strombidinopsis sp, Strain SopsisLIS2011" /LENGTH=119 /DNA_ID=CAMNT_0004506437 /DNA_START=18 /DNA_END=377 /DNA_ORIENTATION=-
MGKIMKKGRVVILTSGRHAGKKAVIVKQYDEGKANKKFSHALVAGIRKYPGKVSKAMSKKKIERRTRLIPFVKFVNYNHLLPTRFMVKEDIDLKSVVSEDKLNNAEARAEMKKSLKNLL